MFQVLTSQQVQTKASRENPFFSMGLSAPVTELSYFIYFNTNRQQQDILEVFEKKTINKICFHLLKTY